MVSRSCSICSVVVLVLLFLLSQNLVGWRMTCFGGLTYSSCISRVIIFMCSSVCFVLSSSSSSCVFLVVYVCGRIIRLFRFCEIFSSFICWCVYIVYNRSGCFLFLMRFYVSIGFCGIGFMFTRYFCVCLSISVLHF